MKKGTGMKNKGLVATIIIMAGVIVMLLVILLFIKMPSIDLIRNKFIDKTVESSIDVTEKIEETTINETEPEKRVSAEVVSYTGYNNNVNIEYPVILGMDDVSMQETVNNKIKTNALSIVPLYPISTALQKLDIYCEVKSIDENHITIIYTGEVVGKSVKKTQSSSSGSSSKSKGGSSSDPYLNGFVDPLAGIPNANNAVGANGASGVNSGGMPLPKTDGSDTGVRVFTNETIKQEIDSVAALEAAASALKNRVSTADKGPTVKEITAPTAKAKSQLSDGNVATNNPTGGGSSTGVVYSGSANYSPNPISSDYAPTDSQIGPGTQGGVTTGAPVYAYAGSNNSASTIDQKIFYTNTIDLKTGKDMTLGDYVDDLEVLAKYTRSSKVEFVNIDSSNRSEVRTYVNKTVPTTMTEQFKVADFRNADLKVWPKNFSYKDADGTVYFSVKLSSKLGNYAIVKYKQ